MSVTFPIIKAYNLDLLIDVAKVLLSTDSDAASSTLTVVSITGISVGDYLLIGEFGHETTEIVRVHTSTAPTGTTVTLNANTVYAHNRDTPIYVIDRNQVEFSRATTLTGSKSVLGTVDIMCDQLHTTYKDVTNSTGFGFYRFSNSADSAFTGYSESYPYAGYGQKTLKRVIDAACLLVGQVDELGNPQLPTSFSRESAVIAVNDCQLEMKELRHRWSYLTNFNYAVSELATGQDSYSLPSDIAQGEGSLSIFAARIGAQKDMKFIDKEILNERRENVVKDSLGSAITATSNTTVTLTDSSDFDSSGSFTVVDDDNTGIDPISYTSNNKATNVVSGVTGIAETHAAGSLVWQGITFGKPTRYAVYEDTIVLDPPPAVAWDNYNLLIDAYINPVVIDDLADEVDFPPSVIKPYLAWRIAQIVDQTKAPNLYGLYLAEQAKILRKESTGQVTRMKPIFKPDVTSNFVLSRTSPDDND